MKIFANMQIGKRLGLGFAVVLALSILMAGIAVWRLTAVASATREMMKQPLTMERAVSDLSRNINVAVARTTVIAKASDTSLAGQFAAEAAALAKSGAGYRKVIESLVTGADAQPEEKEIFARLSATQKVYSDSRDQVLKLKGEGNTEAANAVLNKTFLPTATSYQDIIADFVTTERRILVSTAARIDSIAEASRNLLVTLAALILLLGVLCAWWLTVGITGPLRKAVAVTRRVADGDLSGEIVVQGRDETGQLMQALKDMNGSLVRIVGQVRLGTDTIATASSEIASGNQDLSSRTEQQASSLEETASSMEELTSTVKQNAENARQANQLAITASGVAVKGGEVVTRVVDTMESINDSAKKIVDIIGVIDGIAFQTNILALNAAVEAARAGEQGRGFAVVASEVRSLAQRSAAAAKEIKTLIGDSVEKVDTGSKLVTEAGSTMEEIVDSVKRVTDIMAEIMAATQEQTAGIEQVNQAISQMDQVTQQNAALVEQAAAASKSMQDQAGNLAKAVSVFRLEGGQKTALIAAPQPYRKPPASRIEKAPASTAAAARPRPAIAAAPTRRTNEAPLIASDGWEQF
jgi:methyl-accepting chemotaxis protein